MPESAVNPAVPPRSPLGPREAVQQVFRASRQAIERLEAIWDEALVADWTAALLAREGRLILSGIGKSGIVAQKVAATFASTGCPSFYVHPADAVHGDLGMVTAQDMVLLLSNSGETEELLRLIPSLARLGVPMGAITARRDSRLGQAVRWCFSYELPAGEGCPLHIAPMASTSLQMLMGDVLAAHRMAAAGFTLEAFARLHPAGNIGARLLKVDDLMHRELPTAPPEAPLVTLLAAMSAGRLGMAAILQEGRLCGVVSDGDIRRALERAEREGANPLGLTAAAILTAHPVTVSTGTQAMEAANLMERRKITFVLVVDGAEPLGVLHIHDLLGAKVL